MTAKTDTLSQTLESKRVRGYLSSVSSRIILGTAQHEKIDLLTVRWQDGTSHQIRDYETSQELNLSEITNKLGVSSTPKSDNIFNEIAPNAVGINFIHVENSFDDFEKEILLPYKQSTLGPSITTTDLNGDGDTDFYIPGASGQAGHLYHSHKSAYHKAQTNNQNQREEMGAAFIDMDADNQLDLYIPSGGNAWDKESHYGDQILTLENSSINISDIISSNSASGKIAMPLDYDNDGDQDLFIGNRMQVKSYPLSADSYLLENNKGLWKDVTEDKFGQSNFGLVNDLLPTDFNGDGWTDLIIVGEWNYIQMWQNDEGTFKEVSKELLRGNSPVGWWYSITELDLNKDGQQDYLVGNVGLNSKYVATNEKPLNVYANDFDDNGSLDFVLSKTYKNKEVPFRGKECSSEQMPFINESFESYASFAQASIEEVLGSKIHNSTKLSCNEFSSIALISQDNGQFSIQPLPFEAQLRPILDAVSIDINKDGQSDIIAVGNIYNTEPETPRLDYQNATVLISDGNGMLHYDAALSAQLPINANSKSIALLQRKNDDDIIIIGINDAPPKCFTVK